MSFQSRGKETEPRGSAVHFNTVENSETHHTLSYIVRSAITSLDARVTDSSGMNQHRTGALSERYTFQRPENCEWQRLGLEMPSSRANRGQSARTLAVRAANFLD